MVLSGRPPRGATNSANWSHSLPRTVERHRPIGVCETTCGCPHLSRAPCVIGCSGYALWALAFYRAMSCRTVKAVARGIERQVQVRVRVRVQVQVQVQVRVQVRVRVRVGVAVGARAALGHGTLMLPRSGIFNADANATRLELATIAANLSCVLGMFIDLDLDRDLDPDTARSVRRPYRRDLAMVPHKSLSRRGSCCCILSATGLGEPGGNTIHGSLRPSANSDHLGASLTAPQDREYPRQQGRENRQAHRRKTRIEPGQTCSPTRTGRSRL